jgi:hypothetical protein
MPSSFELKLGKTRVWPLKNWNSLREAFLIKRLSFSKEFGRVRTHWRWDALNIKNQRKRCTCEGSCKIRPSFINKDEEWPGKLQWFYCTSNSDQRFTRANILYRNYAKIPQLSRRTFEETCALLFLWGLSNNKTTNYSICSSPALLFTWFECLIRASFCDHGEHSK